MIISIIIPTKNRYTTLFSVVDMILSFNLNDDIEVVIQDNSDNNEQALKFVSERKAYANLKYFHSHENLSVIENSDKAVLNSSGEYVCFIGDDDGVMPNIVEVVKWMKEKGYKALKSYKPRYYWPDQKSNFLSDNTSGVLRYAEWKKQSFKVVKTSIALNKTLNKGGAVLRNLPCLYHGIVKRETLNKIYKKTETFFPGPSPDMANAVALTQVLDSFVYTDYPVVISGKSTKSTGGAGVLHQHVARIEEVKHLPSDTSVNWDNRIPKYWTGPTIWAESVIKALEAFQNYKAVESLNFEYLYAFLKVFHKKHSEEIFKNFKINKSLNLYFLMTKIFLYRLQVFIKNRIGVEKQFNNIKDMNSAVDIISSVK
ncbi:glycosyltransferase [Planobacterium oryzisoli]|uniref:Glycosyltransferase n=1 Tax=Planobacterium oryzisoli TaxID=2771435 RepID=A0A931EBI3_9FLAO|nr:glycosyltransferase [Planobacterium oryzisoli]MBF5027129.1 glycosyltransferase [Planobacterium oryzisoli]